MRRSGHSRNLVRQLIRGERTDVFRVRQSSLNAQLPLLDELWASGCTPAGQRLSRFLRVVAEWSTRRRRGERASDHQIQKVPSARTIARLMTTVRDHLTKSHTVAIAAIETGGPVLVEARCLIDRFHSMVRKRIEAIPCSVDASTSVIASFASGITSDRAAVRATTPNLGQRQTVGQIMKLKLVKRQSVWTRKTRPPANPTDRRCMNENFIEIA
ncbi:MULTISPECIES: hypothetical protein [unclassified Mesorhizobium]|uniref:hypothetical protein n=1 Tax=unclassified Mesorhizobium TaxID=325217 RepID=UPI000FE813C6|nr:MULTISPECIES: hypothetical protein [unclassified Mesorhizobium]RWB97654.1 MAG: hypothetical protein EOQ57_24010 [Mesorhizobium sp.]TGV22109.1 hypothetical protein EN786_30650 [Mesorhizobium sp. M4B.F.Ca.ET.143.01.1.1]